MRVRIAHLVDQTAAEGPGVRSAIWLQGCSIRCPGCFNPHTWSPDGGRDSTVGELSGWLSTRTGIEGITLLGGEPFDQAGACAELAIHAQRIGLSVMTFTGYELETLQNDDRAEVTALLAATDLLVDGPYDQSKPETRRPWLGSTNQRFHCLSNRYANAIEELTMSQNRVEVRIRPGGTVFINGMADSTALGGLRQGLRRPARSV